MPLVAQDHKDQPEPQELLEPLDHKDLKDLLVDHRDRKDHKAHRDPLDRRVVEEPQVLVPRVQLDQLDHKVLRALPDHKARAVPQVQLAHKDHVDHRDPTEPPD